MNLTFLRDLAERTATAGAVAFAGALLLAPHTGIDLSTIHAAEFAGEIAALRVVAGMLSSLYGDPNSAAVLSKRPQGRHRRGKAHPATYTITRRHIPEIGPISDKRLGRHVNHDSRSLNYLVAPIKGAPQSARWTRRTPILDQGNLGSCTGNATCGTLGTDGYYGSLAALLAAGLILNEPEAVKIYSLATSLDSYAGTYPPSDTGSDGLSAAKAAKQLGLISAYQHITSVAAAQAAILTGPFIIGSDWYTSFDTPDGNGLVAIAKGATVRGGHEYSCIGYDATTDVWELVNSWGPSFGIGGHFFYSSATFAKLLASDGDATTFVPIATPAPTPTPTPTPVPVGVVVDDPVLVAKISGIATKDGMSPHDFLAKRLHALYKV